MFRKGKLEARWEKRAVYMLTSFIEAHVHAQNKIHSFISSDDEPNYEGGQMDEKTFVEGSQVSSTQTPEELQVIEESQIAVCWKILVSKFISRDSIFYKSFNVLCMLLMQQKEFVLIYFLVLLLYKSLLCC